MVEERKKNLNTTKVTAGKEPRLFLQLLLVLLFISVGLALMFGLIKFRKPPKTNPPESFAPLVKVEEARVQDIRMIVSGSGTVKPKVEVEIVPQVSGKIVWINPQFKAGGFIRSEEKLLKIDPRDYELAVQQAEAAVAEAEVYLDVEQSEAQVAKTEWRQLHPDTEPSSPLVLREPQIKQAEARLKSAEAALATAKLSLERTQLSLPLDVRVVSETVDLGQYVMAGKTLGTSYGVEAVEIELPLEDWELAWFEIPDARVSYNGGNPSNKKTVAKVKAEFAGTEHTWEGYVVRTVGQVDKTSRMISVVVEVPEPFDTSGGKAALLPGIFAQVLIEGEFLKDAVAIPRDVLREDSKVWVVRNKRLYVQPFRIVQAALLPGIISEPLFVGNVFVGALIMPQEVLNQRVEVCRVGEKRLYIQPLKIVRKDQDYAYAVSGLIDGDMFVTSSLDMVTDGMKVRLETDAASKLGKTVSEQIVE